MGEQDVLKMAAEATRINKGVKYEVRVYFTHTIWHGMNNYFHLT